MEFSGSIPDARSDARGVLARVPHLPARAGLAFFGLALIAAVWAAAIAQTRFERQQAIANIVQQNSNLAIAFEQYITRTLQTADAVARYVGREYLRTGAPFQIARFLADQAIDQGLFAAVSIVDTHGDVIASSSPLLPHPMNIARQEQFRVQVRRDSGLYIGKPVQLQRIDHPLIVMTRRITRPDGRFGGVVALLIDPHRLTDFYSKATIRDRDVLSVTGLDGIVRSRRFGQSERAGEDLTGSQLLAERTLRPNGSYHGAAKLDGVVRFFSYRTLADYPLVATVGMSEDDALYPVRKRGDRYYWSAGAATVLIALFTALLMASLGRQRRAAADLAQSEQRYRHIVETAQEGIWLVDERACTVFANPKLEQMLGCRRGEMAGRSVYEFMDEEERGRAQIGFKRRAEGRIEQHEVRFRRDDGSELWAVLATNPVAGPDGRYAGELAMVTEITERKRQEDKIARLSRIQKVLSGINSVIVRVRSRQALFDESCRIAVEHGGFEMAWVGLLDRETLDVTTAAHLGIDAELLGHLKLSARADLPAGQGPTGRSLRERRPAFNNDMQSQPHQGPLRRQIAARGYHSTISLPLLEGGEPIGVLALFARVRNFFDSEEVSLLSELAADISFALEFIDREEKLNYLALYDMLTRLPNRTLFFDRLSQALSQAKRDGKLAGVMFIDLDRFKSINDTYGHGVGDDLLRLVGERLRESVREIDTVGRLGGDEFAIALSGLASSDDANLVAQKVIAALARPFDLQGRETYMTASIGLALYPLDAEHAEALIKNADTAMYRAKQQGRNSYEFYRPSMNERASEQLHLETELRGALRREEFLLHFQPKIRLPDGRISGFEALLRWRHPERGLVWPHEFIATLEDTGMIVPVGEWVMRSVCDQIRRWQDAGLESRPVAVNLSARQFQHERLESVVGEILASTGINPRLLEFELTESLLMSEAQEAARTLNALKAYGVGLSVDDFGTGYSSLAYLKRFPLDVLKVDRAFVRDITRDADDAAITQAIITLAHSLKLKVVAEGVETREQAEFLEGLGCDELQGYYFGEPRLAREYEDALRAEAADRHLRRA